jgi:hypothetical protein
MFAIIADGFRVFNVVGNVAIAKTAFAANRARMGHDLFFLFP